MHGNTFGLKPSHVRMLESVASRRNPPESLLGATCAALLLEISHSTGREVGILVDRKGVVRDVVVGTSETLILPAPDLPEGGLMPGLRLLHAHPGVRGLSEEDLTLLYSHRLDAVVVCIRQHPDAFVQVSWAYLDDAVHPEPVVQPFVSLGRLELNFQVWIAQRDDRMQRTRARTVRHTERALLMVVADERTRLERRLTELRELARTAGVEVIDVAFQLRPRPDPRTLIGRGKLEEILHTLGRYELDLLIVDPALTPTQARRLSELTPVRIVDRTMLILDIFAQRAQTREGKIQVELAQLKYTLPRLVGKNSFMSRLMGGGTGGRGPGETKLEIDRRRVRERIDRLEKQIDAIAAQRAVQRKKRKESHLPVVSVVGYTNAGKSTLLHALTGADVFMEDKLFATLDPRTRRVRYPNEAEIIFTDTVGFIEDLPPDLVRAFRATLEELEQADLLIHLVDASDPDHDFKRREVERILTEMHLDGIPRFTVYNKCDRLPLFPTSSGRDLHISALQPETLVPLVERILVFFRKKRHAIHPFSYNAPPQTNAVRE